MNDWDYELLSYSAHIAKDFNTSIGKLIELSKHENYMVRWRVAENPNTPIDILIGLSKDKYAYVRVGLANNPNTPLEVLLNLSKDEEDIICYYAMKNRKNRLRLLK